ncbi:MAG: hypothetical protein M3389_00630 [Actinomycetota bacterium]|nr:hypothetical protein [Actinomycetota bacterium]
METALRPTEVVDVFRSSLLVNTTDHRTPRGWTEAPITAFRDHIPNMLAAAAASPVPAGRAPQILCVVIPSHSHGRTEAYMGGSPADRHSAVGSVFVARHLARISAALTAADPGARRSWAHPAHTPLAHVPAKDRD